MVGVKAADLFPFRQEARAGLRRAVASLPAEHLVWKPAGGVHTIADWLRHIAQTEDWWVQAVILGRTQFAARPLHRLREREELLAYLESTRSATEELLQEWPAEKLQENRLVPQKLCGAPIGPPVSLSWIMQRLFAHELHHRGQIYLYLELMGLEPPED